VDRLVDGIDRRLNFQGLGGAGVSAPIGSPAASIRAEVQDSAPGVTAMGGKLVFSTSDQGTTNLADRMTIDNKVGSCTGALNTRAHFMVVPLQGSVIIGVVTIGPNGDVNSTENLHFFGAGSVSILPETGNIDTTSSADTLILTNGGEYVSACQWSMFGVV
jgi:hypothetical protein